MAEDFRAWEGVSPLLLRQQLHDVVHVHPGRGAACTATAAHAVGSMLDSSPACSRGTWASTAQDSHWPGAGSSRAASRVAVSSSRAAAGRALTVAVCYLLVVAILWQQTACQEGAQCSGATPSQRGRNMRCLTHGVNAVNLSSVWRPTDEITPAQELQHLRKGSSSCRVAAAGSSLMPCCLLLPRRSAWAGRPTQMARELMPGVAIHCKTCARRAGQTCTASPPVLSNSKASATVPWAPTASSIASAPRPSVASLIAVTTPCLSLPSAGMAPRAVASSRRSGTVSIANTCSLGMWGWNWRRRCPTPVPVPQLAPASQRPPRQAAGACRVSHMMVSQGPTGTCFQAFAKNICLMGAAGRSRWSTGRETS